MGDETIMKTLKSILKEDDSQMRSTVEKLSGEVEQVIKNPQGANAILGYLLGVMGMKGRIELKDFEKAVESAKSYRK